MTPSDRTDLHLYVRFIEVALGGWDTHSDNFEGPHSRPMCWTRR